MRRCEVWLIHLDPAQGSELKRTRPVVIVNSDSMGVLPLRVVVPLVEWKDQYQQAAWIVKIESGQINSMVKTYAADTFQIRSVSTGRFTRKLSEISQEEMNRIIEAIGLVIEYPLL
jgi:mRNA interferase MazF